VEKLTIWTCTIQKNGVAKPKTKASDKKYQVMVNPTSFTHAAAITYTTAEKAPVGVSAAQPKFQATQPESLSFEVLIDGTGVVDSSRTDLADELTNLKSMLYFYDGSIHQTPVVYLTWGSFSFLGRLKSMGIKYTLFKPNGEPLRGRVSLTFTSYLSAVEEAKKANKTSPDLTHRIEVVAGDSLPLLCHRIYRNSAYYLQIARINGLTNFRNLKPGTTLNFPPLR
jgi:nucleoid-associated protein YgaU